MKAISVSLLLLLITVAPCLAGGGDIAGSWLNQDKDARIEISQCGQKYCGKIVWLREPNYPVGSKEGTPGTPKVDHNNPDVNLRKTPVLGMEIMHDFEPEKDGFWTNGKIYDPKSGKTYSGKITMVSPNELRLRGYVGISLIGRTEVWTRAN
ncbi:MAG: DUF2147 domain-containing protein [Terriglobales bacterium]|jgi:uncharacterized protein (DUF2147 family)